MVVERRAEGGLMRLEHRGNLLRVVAYSLFERLAVRVKSHTEVLHRRHDLIFEPFNADAERLGDVLNSAGQRRVDVLGERRQGLRQLAGSLMQRFADLRRLGVHPLGDFATAFAERAGGFERVSGERLRQRPPALGKAIFDAGEQGFQRRRDLVELCFGALVHSLQAGVENRSGLFVSAAEFFVHRSAALDQRLLNHRKFGGKIGRKRLRPLANSLNEVAAAAVDDALESRKPVSNGGFDAPRMRIQGEIDGIVVSSRRGLELPQPVGRFRRQLLEMIGKMLIEVVAAGAHQHVDCIQMAGDARAEFVSMGGDPVDDAVSVIADQIVERFHIVAHSCGLLRQELDQLRAAVADNRAERDDLLPQIVVDDARADSHGRSGFARERGESGIDLV